MKTSRHVLTRIVVLVTGTRVALWVLGQLSVASSGLDTWFRLEHWGGWDAHHFLRVAEVGYRTVGEDALYIVFLPAYPAAVRLLSFVFGNVILSALVVSYFASIGAGWFLYKLVELEADDDEAWRAVIWLFAFPTSYFLAAPYSEALFLLAALAALYAARTSRWGRAAGAGIVATATRLQALPMLVALAVDAIARGRNWPARIRALAWTGLAAGGFAIYLAINWLVHGDPLHFVGVQSGHWNNRAAPPWYPLVEAVRAIAGSDLTTSLAIIFWGRLLATGLAIVLLVAGRRRLNLADNVYAWVALILILSSSWLLSMPRYLLGVYPLFIVLSHETRSGKVFWPLLAVSVAGQGALFWRYAQGAWTF